MMTLSGLLVACGSGGSNGYYNQPNNGGNITTPSTDFNEAQKTLDSLKLEGQFLFGNYDPTDATTAKGFIDHALDTFAQGPLQLAIDTKKLFEQDKSLFTYYETCFGGENNQLYEKTPCYALEGEENIKRALNKIAPNIYTDWDFEITPDQLTKLKITPNQIEKFTGHTFLLIFDNQNEDKAFNDIWIGGVFGYPYQQSWGLKQSKQLRFISMNGDGQYQVTYTTPKQDEEGNIIEEQKSYGALSIYKDPTSREGDLYVLQNQSSFDVLTNDNPNTPDLELINFSINSVPGDVQSLATYRSRPNGLLTLNIPSITTISGTRIENESPNDNSQSFTGSIFLEGTNIFKFTKALNGAKLNFKHVFNGITYEGESINNNGTINTTLTREVVPHV